MWISKIVILVAGVALMSLSAQSYTPSAAAESVVSSEARAQATGDPADLGAEDSAT